MNQNIKIFLSLVVIIVIIGLVGVYLYGKNQSNNNNSGQTSIGSTSDNEAGNVAGTTTQNPDDYLIKLAKYLTQQGMVLYGSYQSEDTINQKNKFESASQYLNYVECDASGPNANPDECLGQKIEIYPTWVFQGKQYVGIQSLADLAKVTKFNE